MNAIDPYERVVAVEVEVTADGDPACPASKVRKTVTRYVVMDTDPAVSKVAKYRTDHALKTYNAWTAFKDEARWRRTRREARDALWALRGQRMMQDPAYKGMTSKQLMGGLA